MTNGPESKIKIFSKFHTSKSAQRTREGALAELKQSLNRLN
ncbi:hypothetical protein [Desulfobacula toluolica]|nr:hypothetical protein [Desulfobacula toluolica]